MATFNVGVLLFGTNPTGQYAPNWTAGALSEVHLLKKVRDMQYGGDGTITGTVKVKGTLSNVPVSRKVRLIREVDGICIRETWSDPVTGVYTFAEIDRNVDYTALSYDYTQAFRAVVADRVVPT
ncbi:MAG: hypothetical protein HEQ39_09745 [Rhizobacter sp.]